MNYDFILILKENRSDNTILYDIYSIFLPYSLIKLLFYTFYGIMYMMALNLATSTAVAPTIAQ